MNAVKSPAQAALRSDDRPAVPPSVAVPAIELVGIAKRFHSRRGVVTAVERVDLMIGEGEFFSLLGPSRCGKTTTLRMIGGFEEPTERQTLLYGRDVVGVPPNLRRRFDRPEAEPMQPDQAFSAVEALDTVEVLGTVVAGNPVGLPVSA